MPQAVLFKCLSCCCDSGVCALLHAQERIVGAHFFSPAHIMPLLEIVRTDKTSPQVLLALTPHSPLWLLYWHPLMCTRQPL